jgi:rhodanese-related sulfurtransferase
MTADLPGAPARVPGAREAATPGIDRARLAALLASDAPVRLLDARGPVAFREAHIPGALTATDPADAADAVVAGETVVVYGTDGRCPAARALVATLEARMPDRVRWYLAGIADWAGAGLPLEGRGC